MRLVNHLLQPNHIFLGQRLRWLNLHKVTIHAVSLPDLFVNEQHVHAVQRTYHRHTSSVVRFVMAKYLYVA